MSAPEPAYPDEWADQSEFRRDMLSALSYLEQHRPGPVHGLGIKEELERRRGEAVNHGRLYPNLDELAANGYIEKGTVDQRTNSYTLTPKGRALIIAAIEKQVHDLDLAASDVKQLLSTNGTGEVELA